MRRLQGLMKAKSMPDLLPTGEKTQGEASDNGTLSDVNLEKDDYDRRAQKVVALHRDRHTETRRKVRVSELELVVRTRERDMLYEPKKSSGAQLFSAEKGCVDGTRVLGEPR